MYGTNTFSEGYLIGKDASSNNNGFFGGDGAWWIIILLLFGYGGFGNGGFGRTQGTVNDGYVLTNDFSQLSKQISDTYNMTDRKFEGVTNGLCDGFYTNAQLISGVNSNIAGAQYALSNAITTNGYETRNAVTGLGSQLASCCCDIRGDIANTNYANAMNTNTLQAQINNCCCDIREGISGINYNSATNTNSIVQAVNNGFCQSNFNASNSTRDIITSTHGDTDRILARLDAMENSRKDEKIAAQQAEINSLQNRIDMSYWSRNIVDEVRPCPRPAYITCNPYAYQSCGCNSNSCC